MTEKFYTIDQIDSLAHKFKERSLPKAEWTHEAHLTVAIWHIYNDDFFEALCKLKSGIILLNASHQTENTSKSGYHETLTIFWSKVIFLFIKANTNLTIENLVSKFLNSEFADKTLPYKFYQKDDLFSALARSIYTEPTLKKLDESAIL